jgi:hypothetical protein
MLRVLFSSEPGHLSAATGRPGSLLNLGIVAGSTMALCVATDDGKLVQPAVIIEGRSDRRD